MQIEMKLGSKIHIIEDEMLSQKLKAVLGLTLVVVAVAGCGAGGDVPKQEETNTERQQDVIESNDEERSVYEIDENGNRMNEQKVVDVSSFPKLKLPLRNEVELPVVIKNEAVNDNTYINLLNSGEVSFKQFSYKKFDKKGNVIGDDEEGGGFVEKLFFSNQFNQEASRDVAYDTFLGNRRFEGISGCYTQGFDPNPPIYQFKDKTQMTVFNADVWGTLYKDEYHEKGWDKDWNESYQMMDGITLGYFGMPLSYLSHQKNYNNPMVLSKHNADGSIAWQKVYLRYAPWWEYCENKVGGDYDVFLYFRVGQITIFDEDRMFIYFGGDNKVYRIDANGNPLAGQDTIITMDYKSYYDIVSKQFEGMDQFSDENKNVNIAPCDTPYYGDYDYTGEILAKHLKIDMESKETLKEIQEGGKSLQSWRATYRKYEEDILEKGE